MTADADAPPGDPDVGGRSGGRLPAPLVARLRDQEDLGPLWDALAHRLSSGEAPVTLTLRGLSMAQRGALADLFGDARLPAATTRVPIRRVLVALGLPDLPALAELVAHLRGPLVDRRALRTADRAARAELWAWAATRAARAPITERLTGRVDRWAERWVTTVRAAGVPGGDIVGHRLRLERALAVLEAMPAEQVTLAALAADHFGDPHALDYGRPAAGLVLDALAAVLGRRRPQDAEETRALWEEVGVVPDPLSSSVLALGLRPPADDPLACWLRASADEGEAVSLTLAQLRRWPLPALPVTARAYVVENPSLLSEACARGWSGPPLICSSGRPTLAVVTLVRQLGRAGAPIAQHADFDPAGLAITAWLAERAGTTPWLMDAGDYRAGVRAVTTGTRGRLAPAARIPPTPWDPRLQAAVGELRVIVYEEDVRAHVLEAIAADRAAQT